MKTPYLDDAIKRHEKALEMNMLSDGGKEALDEFKAIKKAILLFSAEKELSDNPFNSWHKNIVKTMEEDIEKLKKHIELKTSKKNQVTCKVSDVLHLNLKEFDKDEL